MPKWRKGGRGRFRPRTSRPSKGGRRRGKGKFLGTHITLRRGGGGGGGGGALPTLSPVPPHLLFFLRSKEGFRQYLGQPFPFSNLNSLLETSNKYSSLKSILLRQFSHSFGHTSSWAPVVQTGGGGGGGGERTGERGEGKFLASMIFGGICWQRSSATNVIHPAGWGGWAEGEGEGEGPDGTTTTTTTTTSSAAIVYISMLAKKRGTHSHLFGLFSLTQFRTGLKEKTGSETKRERQRTDGSGNRNWRTFVSLFRWRENEEREEELQINASTGREGKRREGNLSAQSWTKPWKGGGGKGGG